MTSVGKSWRVLALAAVVAACNGDGGTEARVATSVTATTPASQSALAGTPVATAPAVRVLDQDGGPMAGVAVSFAVTGGGTVAATSATTDASGNASAGTWTLGTTPGTQTVTATVAGLSPVQFSATAQDPCTTATAYTLASAVSGNLGGPDCRLSSGEYVDLYATNLPSAQAVAFNMTSSAFDTWVELYDGTGNILAINDDGPTGTNSSLRVFAPSGNYLLAASSFSAGATGAYQLSSSGVTGNVNCDEYWVVPGVSITGSVATTDCDFGGFYVDEYLLVVRPGQTITLRLESTAFDAYLELYDLDGNLIDSDDDGAGGNNSLITYTYAGTSPTLVYVDATTFSSGATGTYTLNVTRS